MKNLKTKINNIIDFNSPDIAWDLLEKLLKELNPCIGSSEADIICEGLEKIDKKLQN